MFTDYTNAYEYELEKSEDEFFLYYKSAFMTDSGDTIRTTFSSDKDDIDTWLFGFSRIHGGEVTQDITGQGDAIRILSTVIKMIIEVATTNNVRFMMFRAENDSVRPKLFERIFNKLTHKYGYKVISQVSETGTTITVARGAIHETV